MAGRRALPDQSGPYRPSGLSQLDLHRWDYRARSRQQPRNSGSPTVEAASHLCMHDFDSRGDFRVYDVTIDDVGWRLGRDAPGFSQRFIGTFADGGQTIDGHWELCEDVMTLHNDLDITYRRRT